MALVSMASALLLLSLVVFSPKPADAQNIGVCYGRNGDNLPSVQDTVKLYKSNGIYKMRIYYPDEDILHALEGSGIGLILDMNNKNVELLGSDSSAATQWVRKNVVPYASTVKYIAVGDNVMPEDSYAHLVLPAMQNVQNALKSFNLTRKIKVSTAVTSELLSNTYPPSSSVFSDSAAKFIHPILKFLQSNGSNLLANIAPYVSLMGDGKDISVKHALFTSPTAVFIDPGNKQSYQNLFDALVDSYYTAIEKAGGDNLNIVVSETGWPSQGSDVATLHNAATYYKNLIGHVANGTPKRPGQPLETYLFTMFDEELKSGDEAEKHYGLFTPNKQNKYEINFTNVPNLLGYLCYD